MLNADENGNKRAGKSGSRKGKPEQQTGKSEPRKKKAASQAEAKPDQPRGRTAQLVEQSNKTTERQIDAPVSSADSAEPRSFLETTQMTSVESTEKGEPRKNETASPQEARPDQPQGGTAQLVERTKEPTERQIDTPVALADSSAETRPSLETTQTAPVEFAATAPVNIRVIAEAYGNYSRISFEQAASFFEKLAGARSLGKALELQAEFARETYETFVAESCKLRAMHAELARQRFRHLEDLMSRMTNPARDPARQG
jgi:hypothetical protein